MERQFRWITDKARIGDVPIGKALLMLLLMGFPGKFTTKVVRYLLGLTGKLTGRTLYQWSNFIGPLVGFGEAYAFKKWLRGPLGETGAEALALATLAGAIDAGFERETIAQLDKDLSDIVADFPRDKFVEIINKIRGVAVSGPGTKLAGFPEAGSSAWREQQKFLASPEARKPVRTAAPRPAAVGAPQKPIDPIQQMEEILAAKSRQ